MEKSISTICGVKCYEENGTAYLELEAVAWGLGFTKTEIKNGKEYASVRWDRVRKYLGLKENPKYITKEQLRKLIQSTNRTIDRKWYDLAGLSVCEVIKTKEQETIGFIADCFASVTQLNFQHKVGNYKIDLYFPEYNIAVECDEFSHLDRDEEYEIKREEFITDQLGCSFIRYNPDAKGFSISSVISEINNVIFERLFGGMKHE